MKSLAQLYSDTYEEINVPEFARSLWGDIYLNSKTRKLAKKSPHGSTQKSPVEFILEPRYKPSAQVVGDVDKSLPMLCEQLGIRLTKDEMKLSIRSLLKIVCSGLLGDFNGFTSMCEEHIPSPVENAKQKVGETSETERYEDMVGDDQDGRLMVHTTKQYSTEDITYFQVLGKMMSGTLGAGQEVRLMGKNYTVPDEEDSRNRKVGRLWVYEARAEESGKHVILGTGELYPDGVKYDLRKFYSEREIEIADTVVSFCEIAEPTEKGPGEDSQDNYIKKVVLKNQCKQDVGTTGYMQKKKSCATRTPNSCTGIMEMNIERVCSDINELADDLVEAIHYETLEEVHQVQRCITGKDKGRGEDIKNEVVTINWIKKRLRESFRTKYDWDLLAARSIWVFAPNLTA